MIKNIFILESSWDDQNALEHISLMPIVNEFAKQRGIKWSMNLDLSLSIDMARALKLFLQSKYRY